ncbi:MAG: hypothetical protein MUO43_12200 [Desulfobacterales bacterium]|nr:hypothetical protein [Desulfobacterales bacterium]
MKKFFVVFTAFAFVMAMGLPALADVTVLGTIDKTKTKTVDESVSIDKAIYVGVKQVIHPSNSAEAQALKNDVNKGNTVTEETTPPVAPTYYTDPIDQQQVMLDPGSPAVPVIKSAVIDGGSMDAAAGIINVNQSPGSINNQGNAVALSYSDIPATVTEVTDPLKGETEYMGGVFLHAESSAELINGGLDDVVDSIGAGNVVTADPGTTRTNTIDGALNGISGILGVNQSAGNINNQNNAASLSVGSAVAALSEADLGLYNVGNVSNENGTVTTDSITNAALASASGIIGVNQSSGNMNNQANVVAACLLVHLP